MTKIGWFLNKIVEDYNGWNLIKSKIGIRIATRIWKVVRAFSQLSTHSLVCIVDIVCIMIVARKW